MMQPVYTYTMQQLVLVLVLIEAFITGHQYMSLLQCVYEATAPHQGTL